MDQPYQQPPQNPPLMTPPTWGVPVASPVVTVGDWFVTTLITAIPLVGLIMLFIWAFGADTNPNKANWAKAALIWHAVALVLMILFFAVFVGLVSHLSNMN
jgi:hypothetical protein